MGKSIRPETFVLKNADKVFEVTLLQVKGATQCILFAPGLGGSPMRHIGLLQTFTQHGISVVAPHFDLLTSSLPSKAELLERSQRLALAEDEFCTQYMSIAGVGHSLGAVILLMHVGATAWTSAREPVIFEGRKVLSQLVLLAPPTDFFPVPTSLASVKVPVQIWAGAKDIITPPTQAKLLKEALNNKTQTELYIVEDVGHFTFMNTLPPHVTDSHPSREVFLMRLGEKASQFILSPW